MSCCCCCCFGTSSRPGAAMASCDSWWSGGGGGGSCSEVLDCDRGLALPGVRCRCGRLAYCFVGVGSRLRCAPVVLGTAEAMETGPLLTGAGRLLGMRAFTAAEVEGAVIAAAAAAAAAAAVVVNVEEEEGEEEEDVEEQVGGWLAVEPELFVRRLGAGGLGDPALDVVGVDEFEICLAFLLFLTFFPASSRPCCCCCCCCCWLFRARFGGSSPAPSIACDVGKQNCGKEKKANQKRWNGPKRKVSLPCFHCQFCRTKPTKERKENQPSSNKQPITEGKQTRLKQRGGGRAEQ